MDQEGTHTAKILAAIAPSGAFVWSSYAFPCCISNIQICEHSGFLALLDTRNCLPPDKGFYGLANALQAKGARVVALPPRKFRGVNQFTSDEREEGGMPSNFRIHVERHFSRVHGCGFFSRKKIPLMYVDLFGNIFSVVRYLCISGRPLHVDATWDETWEDGDTMGLRFLIFHNV
jgi:hypothetical protein